MEGVQTLGSEIWLHITRLNRNEREFLRRIDVSFLYRLVLIIHYYYCYYYLHVRERLTKRNNRGNPCIRFHRHTYTCTWCMLWLLGFNCIWLIESLLIYTTMCLPTR